MTKISILIDTIKNAKERLAESNFIKAQEIVGNYLDQSEYFALQEIKNRFIVLSANYYGVEKRIQRGELTLEKYNAQRNLILHRFLKLCDELLLADSPDDYDLIEDISTNYPKKEIQIRISNNLEDFDEKAKASLFNFIGIMIEKEVDVRISKISEGSTLLDIIGDTELINEILKNKLRIISDTIKHESIVAILSIEEVQLTSFKKMSKENLNLALRALTAMVRIDNIIEAGANLSNIFSDISMSKNQKLGVYKRVWFNEFLSFSEFKDIRSFILEGEYESQHEYS